MAREIDFMSQYGYSYLCCDFSMARGGVCYHRRKENCMENEALTKAGTKINQIIRELRATADHNQTMYHDIFLNILAIQRELEDTLKLLQKAEHPE